MPAHRSAPGASLCSLLLLVLLPIAPPAQAATEQEAAGLARERRFADAAEVYRELVAQNPGAVRLRLAFADALSNDRRWSEAIAEYENVLRLDPRNLEALGSIGSLRRWQGHIDESKQAFERMRATAPRDSAPALGLAATYAADHDFTRAQALYDEAAGLKPGDPVVERERYDFRRQANPRLNVYFEDDLSFQTRIAGVAVPFLAREEIAYERQQELRFLSATGERTFTRNDNRVAYTHFFGVNNTLEASLRSSSFSYEPAATPTPGVFTTTIDSFNEIRVRYAHPITPEQVAAVRYTARPTTLFGGETFTSHKIEAEAQSQWTPRLRTTVGTGWLRDLKGTAIAVSDTANEVLLNLGAQITLTDRADVSARYITNPDLDSSISSTTLLQGGYSFSGTWSGIVRLRFDDYKAPPDQSSFYAGVRFTPSSHLWTEFGVKYVERGPSDGLFGLASVVYRF
ncbi:MAG: tetratricopeptide repeat protein [Burkholderiales bacterium]